MNYTDTQLKVALAKMLPPELSNGASGKDLIWCDSCRDVLDTELLHICWLVEQTFSETQHVLYREHLHHIINLSYGTSISASWQARTIAMCKVKGVEIV